MVRARGASVTALPCTLTGVIERASSVTYAAARPRTPFHAIGAVPVLSATTTREPSRLRNAETFSAGSAAPASSRTAPGRMNRL